MKNLLKTILLVTSLSLVSFSPTYAKNGTSCYSINHDKDQSFRCETLWSQPVTIDQIYQKGYKVVHAYKEKMYSRLIIEEQ